MVPQNGGVWRGPAFVAERQSDQEVFGLIVRRFRKDGQLTESEFAFRISQVAWQATGRLHLWDDRAVRRLESGQMLISPFLAHCIANALHATATDQALLFEAAHYHGVGEAVLNRLLQQKLGEARELDHELERLHHQSPAPLNLHDALPPIPAIVVAALPVDRGGRVPDLTLDEAREIVNLIIEVATS